MARKPRILDINIALSVDNLLGGFLRTGLPPSVKIENADPDNPNQPWVNITLDPQADYDYLRFTPINNKEICIDSTQFKFLGVTLVSDSLDSTRGFNSEWGQPIFGLEDPINSEAKAAGKLVSTMAIFIDDDLDDALHNFSIMYWSKPKPSSSKGYIHIYDPGIRNNES